MSRPAATPETNKFARYRATQRRRGLKLLRMWVPDPAAPGFAEEAARQAKIINNAPDAADTNAFLEAAFASLDAEMTRIEEGEPGSRIHTRK